jgi:non-heme chloroperoxidase
MSIGVSTKDNVDIFLTDTGEGQLVVFSHGWPLNGDAWDDAVMFSARTGRTLLWGGPLGGHSQAYNLAGGDSDRASEVSRTTESPSGSAVTMLSTVSPLGRSYRTPCR